MINIDYQGVAYLASCKQPVLKDELLERWKNGKHNELFNFDKVQISMARWLGQSMSKTSGLVLCSWYAVVATYQK